MSEPKAFASLSSGLLARKGAAKPAMRPQGFGQMGSMGIEDLGWNDMGQASAAPHQVEPQQLPEHVPSSIAALTPAPRSEPLPEMRAEEAAPPPVLEQQRAIEASFSEPVQAAEPEAAPEPVGPPLQAVEAKPASASVVKLPPRPRSERGAKAKAAFTLRLDAERHLKLRLACAVTHRSAQQIVSGALDDYLASLPELEVLASKVPSSRGNA